MNTLLLLISGLLFVSSSLCKKGGKWNNRTLDYEVIPRTFSGSPQGTGDNIPPAAIEDSTASHHRDSKARHHKDSKARHHRDKCPTGKSNVLNLKVSNTTIEYLTSSMSVKLIPAIYIAVFLIGVPANAITLWMLFFKIRSVRTAIFYTNLAISDFLFCIMLPFKISYHLRGNNWIFGEAMCRIMTAIFYGNMYCSTLLLTCISISRYVAIVHPFTYRTLPKRTLAILACGVIWTVVFLYMLPLILTKQSYYLDQLNIYTCHDVHNICETLSAFQFYYFISLAVFGFVIPLCVVIFCYVLIIWTLRAYDQKWFWYIKVSFLVLSIFAVCYTPSNIILIAHHVNFYYNYKDNLYFYHLIALCLSSLNSCLDPFLYFLMSKIKVHTSAFLPVVKKSPERRNVRPPFCI